MRKILLSGLLLLGGTLAFGQGQNYPPDSDKGIAQGFGSGLLTNICSVADVGIPTVGTSEEVLATCTIPADSFPSAFTGFEVFATYIGAANANAKTGNVRVDGIAGSIILAFTGDTDSADTYELSGDVKVDGGGAAGILAGQGIFTQGTGTNSTFRIRVTGLTFTGDIDVVFTGETAAGAGDVTLTSYMVRMMTGATGESGAHWNGGVFDSPALAPNGTIAVPGYGFSGDSAMGLSRGGTGQLNIYSNNVGASGYSFASLQPTNLTISNFSSSGGVQQNNLVLQTSVNQSILFSENRVLTPDIMTYLMLDSSTVEPHAYFALGTSTLRFLDLLDDFEDGVTPQRQAFFYRHYNTATNFDGLAFTLPEAGSDLSLEAVTGGTGVDDLNILLTPAGTGNVEVTSGQLLVPPGTADLMGLGFSNDPDTGLYKPFGNTVRMCAGFGSCTSYAEAGPGAASVEAQNGANQATASTSTVDDDSVARLSAYDDSSGHWARVEVDVDNTNERIEIEFPGKPSITTFKEAPAAGASGNLIDNVTTLDAMDGSDTVNALNLALTNADHTSTLNFLNAISVGSITGDAEADETGLFVQDGWDNFLKVEEGADVATFQVPALTADRNYSFPDLTGTALLGGAANVLGGTTSFGLGESTTTFTTTDTTFDFTDGASQTLALALRNTTIPFQLDWTDGTDTLEIVSDFTGDKDKAFVIEALATGNTMGLYMDRNSGWVSLINVTAAGNTAQVMAEGNFAGLEYVDSSGFDSAIWSAGDYIRLATENAPRLYIRNPPKALTAATPTAIVRAGAPTGAVTGFTVNWSVSADDATDFQLRRGSTYVAAINKAAITCTVSDVGTSAFIESAGGSTLTVTTSCAASGSNVNFLIEAASSLTETTLEVFFTVEKDGLGSVTAL